MPLHLIHRQLPRIVRGGSDMESNLMTISQASEFLFGDVSRANYERTRRLLKRDEIHTLKFGKTVYVSKIVLSKIIQGEQAPSEALTFKHSN